MLLNSLWLYYYLLNNRKMSLNSFPSLKPKENSFFFPIFVFKQLEKKKKKLFSKFRDEKIIF